MDVVRRIAEILGFSIEDETRGSSKLDHVRRVADMVVGKENDADYAEQVIEAEKQVNERGARALLQCLGAVNAPPPEREYKIKRSEKGQRIGIKSASGKSFAFGPVWVEAVRACKNLATNANNREKLNMHGTHVGIENPEKMSARELCVAITARLEEQG